MIPRIVRLLRPVTASRAVAKINSTHFRRYQHTHSVLSEQLALSKEIIENYRQQFATIKSNTDTDFAVRFANLRKLHQIELVIFKYREVYPDFYANVFKSKADLLGEIKLDREQGILFWLNDRYQPRSSERNLQEIRKLQKELQAMDKSLVTHSPVEKMEVEMRLMAARVAYFKGCPIVAILNQGNAKYFINNVREQGYFTLLVCETGTKEYPNSLHVDATIYVNDFTRADEVRTAVDQFKNKMVGTTFDFTIQISNGWEAVTDNKPQDEQKAIVRLTK